MSDDLLGRDDELSVLRTAQARHAPGVIVTAPAGMGRTGVLSAMVSEWRDRRLDVALAGGKEKRRHAAVRVDELVAGEVAIDARHADRAGRRRRTRAVVAEIDDDDAIRVDRHIGRLQIGQRRLGDNGLLRSVRFELCLGADRQCE